MPATKQHTLKCFKGHSGTKRKSNLAAARAVKAAKRLESTEVPMEAGDVQEHVLEASGFPDCSGDLTAENERLQQNRVESASASKLRKFRDHAGAQDNVCNDSGRSWVLMEVGQLNQLLSAALCSECGQQTLSVVLDGKMGMAREMSLVCPDCELTNESLHSVIWAHCPKTVFVGAKRLRAAVSEAIGKYNRGNFHLAEVMWNMSVPATEATVLLLDQADSIRVRKADKAAQPAFVAARRTRHVDHALAVAQQEDAEGETYGPGLLGGQQ